MDSNQGQQPVVVRARRPALYVAMGVLLLGLLSGAVYVLLRPAKPPPLVNRRISQSSVEPWSYAEKAADSYPPTPSKQEFMEIFHNARIAMKSNQNTEKYLSAQLLWDASHSVSGTGKNQDGLQINSVEQRDPGGYFQDLLVDLPPEDNIQINDMVVSSGTEDLKAPEFYIENTSTHNLTKFVVTRWRYWVKLTGTATTAGGVKEPGEIRFVYDTGSWKYFFENWKQPYQQ